MRISGAPGVWPGEGLFLFAGVRFRFYKTPLISLYNDKVTEILSEKPPEIANFTNSGGCLSKRYYFPSWRGAAGGAGGAGA